MNVVREDEPFDSSVTEDSPVIQPEEHSILSEIGDAYFISVSDSHRFKQWLTALKIKYWIDFGSNVDYIVDWLRITSKDSDSDLVELIIKLKINHHIPFVRHLSIFFQNFDFVCFRYFK
jgi:hypothetical protein